MEENLIREIIARGSRVDGRKFEEYREIKIERNLISNAEGSAKVCIGDTKVVAGVKLEPGAPFPDSPNEGVLMVNAEFLPLASEEFEPGPPREEAIELARVVDRVIRESKAIPLEELVIAKDLVWKVMIDLVVLDHNGNLIDASCLAAVAALKDAKIPKVELVENRPIVDREVIAGNVRLTRLPVAVTVCKIGNTLFVDPNLKEEDALDARLTVGMFFENEKAKICALQKGGSRGFTPEEIEQALDLAIAKGKELLGFLS